MVSSFFSFTRNDLVLFADSLVLLTSGFLAMALDPSENGFGFLTLNLSPVLLLLGFILPVFGILGLSNIRNAIKRRRSFTNFKANKWDILAGISVFSIPLATYLITLEPTASLWDCSEFIACAYKLQVPHTPGNPLFLLVGRIFTMFSFRDVNEVAWWMNFMSALFASGAILFTFLILIDIGNSIRKRINVPDYIVLAASCFGALVLAFTDTFWFSAVEAETYAAGGFFLVFNVWLGFRYLRMNNPEIKKRWVLLTSYLVSLSYCVHPMSLLAIPVIAFCWFLENRPFTAKNVAFSLAIGLGALLLINRIIAVGIFEWAFYLDIFLVNKLSLPFYSGAWIMLILLISVSFFLSRKLPKYNVINWSVLLMMLGFAPYLILFIRSNFNPPIDEHNPENLASIKAYMNRESYPSRPLIYGPYFDAEIVDFEEGIKAYFKDKDTYSVAGHRSDYRYENKRMTILPRMYSRDEDHIQQYRLWADLRPNEKPDFVDNIKYLFRYQLGHMYFRYLMWNFSGRVSDIQHDDWLNPWDDPNTEFNNRATNQYWMIPFLIGLLGAYFLYQNHRKNFFAILCYFLLTGVVLSLYLNSPPQEPRERDYIYVGSFMAFSIWIGLGTMGVYFYLNQMAAFKKWSVLAVLLLSTGTLILLFSQNLDDHDRSGRTVHMDSARNLLNTCEPNAILFTGGDNDTFPLWYLQEVEGFRTDVRVIVLSYFNTDWYINQLRNTYYQSESFELSMGRDDYRQFGPNDVLYFRENPSVKGAIDAEKYLTLLHDEHPALRLKTSEGDEVSIIPSKMLNIHFDKAKNESKLNIPEYMKDDIQEKLLLKMKNNYLEKNALVFLDLLISNQWERPIYFNYTSINTMGLDVKPYLVQEGQLFQFLPVKSGSGKLLVNREKMFEHLVNTQDFDNLLDADIYLNHEDYLSRIVVPLGQYFNSLAIAYLSNGDHKKAGEVMKKSMSLINSAHIPPTYNDIQTMQILLALDEDEKVQEIGARSFRYFSKKAESDTYDAGNRELDQYVLQQTSMLLSQLEDSGSEKEIDGLK